MDPGFLNSFQVTKNGIYFQDFVKTIVLSRNMTRDAIIDYLKDKIIKFVDNLPFNQEIYEINENRVSKVSDDIFIGQIAPSSQSNVLEAISLMIYSFDPVQKHNSLKSTGDIIIILTPLDASYYVEEYFYNFVKLKTYINDIHLFFINFGDTENRNYPIFYYINDEDLLEQQNLVSKNFNFIYRNLNHQ